METAVIFIFPLGFFAASWAGGAFVSALFRQSRWPLVALTILLLTGAVSFTILTHYTPEMHPVEQLIYLVTAIAAPWLGRRFVLRRHAA
jgi:uncharacterized membrane protein YoaK (UPF0700 family)